MSGVRTEKISGGESTVAILRRDGEVIRTIAKGVADTGKPTQKLPDRYEISLVIRDKLTGEVRKYEVTD